MRGSAAARQLPGLLLALGVGLLGVWLSGLLSGQLFGLKKSPVSPVMLSIVIGMLLGNLIRLPDFLRPGLRFAATRILRLGIILLGFRLSLHEIARLGAMSLPLVIACILGGIFFTALLARWLSLPARLGTLIGVGTSICGISAIAATGPVIEARDEEVAYAITVISVFGLLAMLVYPYLAHALFGADATAAGLFLGTAVHDTSQVNGAGIIYSEIHQAPRALDAAIVTKLLRNLFMLGVIPLMAYRYHRGQSAAGDATVRQQGLARLFPLFVLGFLFLAILRSLGDLALDRSWISGAGSQSAWLALQGYAGRAATACMTVALAAVGLGTDFRSFQRLSAKPFFAGLGAALAVGVLSWVGILILR